jgi:hypothetical protein
VYIALLFLLREGDALAAEAVVRQGVWCWHQGLRFL